MSINSRLLQAARSHADSSEGQILTERDLELAVLECQLQNALLAQQVQGMVSALVVAKKFAMTRQFTDLSSEDVLELDMNLAQCIEPEFVEYRKVPAVFSDGNSGAHHREIPRLMQQWAEAYASQELLPLELYKVYEEIHPRVDGNGRAGFAEWMISTYWQYGRWSLELPPDVFGGCTARITGGSAFGPIEP